MFCATTLQLHLIIQKWKELVATPYFGLFAGSQLGVMEFISKLNCTVVKILCKDKKYP
jgi:hypothetical protein